ncbi:MAG: tetratricopeptide repeat protein [Sphingobacterium sp.]|nr:tetratricopeptide repeat protein [Sphingobacterium sp.]
MKGEPIASAGIWYRLGLDLYGCGRPEEAADCFAKADRPEADPPWRFGARGWLGLLDDLRGRRADALAHYRAALSIATDRPVRHDQFGITMSRTWVEERLRTPYAPGVRTRVPDRPTPEDLITIVDEMNWEKEGDVPRLVFQKAAGMTIAERDFWFKLGLLLYDSGNDRESLEAFDKDGRPGEDGRVRLRRARLAGPHARPARGPRGGARLLQGSAQDRPRHGHET